MQKKRSRKKTAKTVHCLERILSVGKWKQVHQSSQDLHVQHTCEDCNSWIIAAVRFFFFASYVCEHRLSQLGHNTFFFLPFSFALEVHDRFDQQTNLDEREKMRAHIHTEEKLLFFFPFLVAMKRNGHRHERDATYHRYILQQLVIHFERRRFDLKTKCACKINWQP